MAIPKKKAPVVPKVPIMPTAPAVLDSTYGMNMSMDQANREQQQAGLVRQGSYDTTDTTEAIRRLAQRNVQSRQSYNDNAARNGSLYSGRATQGFGLMNQGYQRQTNDMQDALARRTGQRALDAGSIANGRSAYDQQQRIANTGRAEQSTWNQRLAMYLAKLQKPMGAA